MGAENRWKSYGGRRKMSTLNLSDKIFVFANHMFLIICFPDDIVSAAVCVKRICQRTCKRDKRRNAPFSSAIHDGGISASAKIQGYLERLWKCLFLYDYRVFFEPAWCCTMVSATGTLISRK